MKSADWHSNCRRPRRSHGEAAALRKRQSRFIDINQAAGCDIAARGEGAGLLKDLKKFESVIKAVVKATKLPVTVKTRLGLTYDNIDILDAAKIAQDQGFKALTVHCRTKSQGYSGKADWSWLEKIRKVISIPLIGNGDTQNSGRRQNGFDLGCDGS